MYCTCAVQQLAGQYIAAVNAGDSGRPIKTKLKYKRQNILALPLSMR